MPDRRKARPVARIAPQRPVLHHFANAQPLDQRIVHRLSGDRPGPPQPAQRPHGECTLRARCGCQVAAHATLPFVASRLPAYAARLLKSTPLENPVFRNFYVGSIGAALGYTMQATISAWLMATLTPSALMVALVQSASTAPTLLFGLFAGPLADIVDRRRVIIVTQILLFAASLCSASPPSSASSDP